MLNNNHFEKIVFVVTLLPNLSQQQQQQHMNASFMRGRLTEREIDRESRVSNGKS